MKRALKKYEGVERNAEYYNAYVPSDLNFNVDWRNLYSKAADLLPTDIGVTIADLGCGPGFFAKTLYKRGYRRYWGVDFSEACIKIARRTVPQFEFAVDNLYVDHIQKRFVDYDIFLLLETLEHLKEDIKVLEAIPKGKKIILSVPSVGGIGHVRRFRTKVSVYSRYGTLINFEEIFGLSTKSSNKKFWLGHGIRT